MGTNLGVMIRTVNLVRCWRGKDLLQSRDFIYIFIVFRIGVDNYSKDPVASVPFVRAKYKKYFYLLFNFFFLRILKAFPTSNF